MWFRNLQCYRLPRAWRVSADELEEQLGGRRFQPCGSQDLEVRGWASPTGDDSLVHRVGGQWLIALGVEQRLLPASVVKQEAAERAEELALQQGYKPGRKQMKDLREEITREFLPRAFTRRRKVFVWIDPVDGWLGIDAPSQTRAEDVLEVLRQTLDSLPLALLRTERSPTAAMADWLAGGEAPAGFSIDDDCELRSVTDERAAVRYVRHSLDGDEVRGHLAGGKMPTRLALTFDDRVSFILTEKLEIKRLDFLDVVKESLEAADTEDAQALFDAGFALTSGELRRLLPALLEALGGETVAEGALAQAA
ncbi:MAG: recombination-associated protein RdgC [Rhodocyclaceae bacterium]|nr:recombination-associated protein RdgC [Rhodocyclaceae bacterium]